MLPLQILPAGGPLPNQQLWHSAPFNLEANIITAVTNERDRLFNIPGTPLPAFANEINRNMARVNNTRQYHNESQLRWNLSQHQAGVPLQHRVPLNNIINKTDLIYRVALTYACFKAGPKSINDNLLKNMFRDLCLLSDEYAFDYKQELKNILTKSEE